MVYHPTKYNVYRDSCGYLWMGHALGLSRFDGNRFTNYFSTDQNSLGISNIFEDRQGTQWCHNFGGQIFYVKNNSFSIVNPNEIIKDYSVTSVVKDKEGNRWIGTMQINKMAIKIHTNKAEILLRKAKLLF